MDQNAKENIQYGEGFWEDQWNGFKNKASWTYDNVLTPVGHFVKDHKLISKGISVVGMLTEQPELELLSAGVGMLGYGEENEGEQYEPKNEVEEYLLSEGVIKNNLTQELLEEVAQLQKEVLRFETINLNPVNSVGTNNIDSVNPLGQLQGRKVTYNETYEEMFMSMDEQFQISYPESVEVEAVIPAEDAELAGLPNGSNLHFLERWDRDNIIKSIKISCNGNKNITINTKQDHLYYAALFTEIYEEANPNLQKNGVNTIYDFRNDDLDTAANNRTINMEKPFNLSDIFGHNSFFSKWFYVSNVTFEYEIEFTPTFMQVFIDRKQPLKSRSTEVEIPMLENETPRVAAGNANANALIAATIISNPRGVLISGTEGTVGGVINEFLPFLETAQTDENTAVWSNTAANLQLIPNNELVNYDIAADENPVQLIPTNEYFDIEPSTTALAVTLEISEVGFEVPPSMISELDEIVSFINYDEIYSLEPYKTITGTEAMWNSWIKFNVKISREEFENELKGIFISHLSKDHPIMSTHGTLKKYQHTNFKKFIPRNNLYQCEKIHIKLGLDYFVRVDKPKPNENRPDNDNVIKYLKKELEFSNIAENLSNAGIFIGMDKLAKYNYLDDIELECEFQLEDSLEDLISVPTSELNDTSEHEYNFRYEPNKLMPQDFVIYAMCDTYMILYGKGTKFVNLQNKDFPQITM